MVFVTDCMFWISIPLVSNIVLLLPSSTSVLRLLLDHYAYIDARLTAGASALYAAVESGRLEAVELLLSRKAQVNFRDVLGQSALALAVQVSLTLTSRACVYARRTGDGVVGGGAGGLDSMRRGIEAAACNYGSLNQPRSER